MAILQVTNQTKLREMRPSPNQQNTDVRSKHYNRGPMSSNGLPVNFIIIIINIIFVYPTGHLGIIWVDQLIIMAMLLQKRNRPNPNHPR